MDEKSTFESEFSEQIVEIAAITGASGIGAGRAGDDILWTASIDLIAWKDLSAGGTVAVEDIRLKWKVSDGEWEHSKHLLNSYSIVKLQVRQAEGSMMLVDVLDSAYRDDELEEILREAMMPVYYMDDTLGRFELDKRIKVFEKEALWENKKCKLFFDFHKDEGKMEAAIHTAHILFEDQEEWSRKIKRFAAGELTELANDWLEDDDESELNEVTQEMFMNLISLESISVYPDGDFEIFFFDGDLFGGHVIIVNGNINGNLTSAEIAG